LNVTDKLSLNRQFYLEKEFVLEKLVGAQILEQHEDFPVRRALDRFLHPENSLSG
jgi:hypothetical protein